MYRLQPKPAGPLSILAEGTESATMDINLIDPAVLFPEDFVISAGRAGDDRFTGLSISHDRDEAEAEGEKVMSNDLDTSVHGTYRHHAKQRLAEGSYYESMIFQEHRFDNLLDDTSKQPLSGLELAEKFTPFFPTMHAVERYGKLQPEPSTFICPSCSDSQGSKDDFDHHVVACRTKVVHANAELDWAHDLQPKMAVACTWQLKPRKTCGKNFADLHKFGRHVLSHVYYSKVCKFPPCQSLAKQPQCETLDAWSDHVATDHGLTWLKPAALVFFCAFCNDHVSFGVSGPSKRVKHYFENLPEAFRSIRQLGYNEVYSTARGNMILSVRNPCFCIFCVHDATLPADVRLAFGNEKTFINHSAEWRQHLLQHFATIEGLTVPCPASAVAGAESPMCLSTKLYTSQELEQHCLEVHRIVRLKRLSTAALPKPSSRSSKRALAALAVATFGIEGAQLGDDNSDGGGNENEQNMTRRKRDQTLFSLCEILTTNEQETCRPSRETGTPRRLLCLTSLL